MNKTGRRGGAWSDRNDLLRVRRDDEYLSLVSRYHLDAAYYVDELERQRNQIVLTPELIGE